MSDTETPEVSPETPGVDPLFPQSTDAAKATRAVNPKAVPADPNAPYGYTKDRATGELRPKLSPGRGPGKAAKSTPAKTTAPPVKRGPANKPRVIEGTATEVDKRTYPERVGELVDSAWILTANVPQTETKLFGVDLGAITIKAKAQGAILREQKGSLMAGVGKMAETSPMIRRGIDWLGSGGGGAVLPAIMLLMPFAAQTANLWRGSVEAAKPLAERTAQEFAALVQAMSGQAAAEAAQLAAFDAENQAYDQAAAAVPVPA